MSNHAMRPHLPTGLQLVRHTDPAAALGLAVSHLMTKPAFAQLTFGSWSRVLVGQINRGHYVLARDATGRTCGFLGWALTDEAAAMDWLGGAEAIAPSNAAQDCIVLNAWSGENDAINRLLLDAARSAAAPYRLIFFKRQYTDGRVRAGRLAVTDAFRHHNRAPLPWGTTSDANRQMD
jgi:hypothetical protein